MALWNREPALILSALNAILALAVGFGAPVTPQQAALINAAVVAVLGLITRSQVTPVKAEPLSVDLSKVGRL